MLSLRSIARSMPRATSQLFSKPAQRQFSAIRRPIALSSPLSRLFPTARFTAPFSSSSRRLEDDTLVAKLTQEIQVEQDNGSRSPNEILERYLKDSDFELHDNAGEDEVVLTRTHGNESIRVSFNTNDFSNSQAYDEAYGDEEEEEVAALANQRGGSRQNTPIAPEDSIEDQDAEDQDSNTPSVPAQLAITITKSDRPGALVLDALARGYEISIENMAYFPDAALAEPKTFEAEVKRRPVYAGPPFGDLDEELQLQMQEYLANRGINDALAGFVAEYVDYKEQAEYVRWLTNLKKFHE